MHYKKFTRGKDLTRRSEKDLANIFGRKTLERIEIPEIKQDEEESEDKSFGVVTVKAGNMADYFKTKFSSFGMFGKASPTIKIEKDEEESESDIGHVGFGFNFKAKEDQTDDSEKTNSFNFRKVQFESAQRFEEETTTKRKRKFNDLKEEECSNEKESKKSKKKKKKLAYDNLGSDVKIDEEMCFDNPCLNDKENTVENCEEENIFEESSSKKKKKVTFSSPITEVLNKSDESNVNQVKVTKKDEKKKKKMMEQGIDNPACEENEMVLEVTPIPEINNFEVEMKISKKKKKNQEENSKVGIDNLACEEISVNEKNEEIRRYKLKKQAMENGIENPACEENLADVNKMTEIAEETNRKSKKSKKRMRESEFEESLNSSTVTVEEETKERKKKKKHKEINEVTENVAVKTPEQEETPKLKRKKKSTEETTVENGITNLACEINTIEEGIANINDEIDNYQNVLENEINFKKIQKLEPNSPELNTSFNSPDTNKNFTFKTGYGPKKSLMDDIKSGNLRLGFQGTNLMKLVGYGAPIHLKARKT